MRRVDPNDLGWYATPAPLPGYTLAILSAFAALPFPVARLLWEILLIACTLIASLALADLTRWPPFVTSICLIPTVGLLNLLYGEFTPIVVAALCVGALALERGFPRVAAMAAGIAMLEPHVGLPALVALAAIVPRARAPALIVAASLAVISVAAIGFNTNVEYFRSVLPVQAFAEVVANDQYSLTYVLALFGTPPSLALLIGSMSYILMMLVGIGLATRLRGRRLAYVMLLPPAAVTLGGSFIHDVQIATALPAALLLAADVPRVRVWAIAAAMLLVVRVQFHGIMAFVSITSLMAVAILGWSILSEQSATLRAVVVATSLLVIGGAYALLSAFPHPASVRGFTMSRSMLPVTTPEESASAAWADYVRARPDMSTASQRYVVEKIPAWLGLVILLACAFSASTVRRSDALLNPRLVDTTPN